MLIIATDVNGSGSVIKGEVIAREDTIHGTERVTVQPLDSFIPVTVDTFHYDVQEVIGFIL